LTLLGFLIVQNYLSYKFPIKQNLFGHSYRDDHLNRATAYVLLLQSGHKFEPVSAEQIEDMIEKAARKYGVDALLIKAIVNYESNYLPHAISTTGAMGLMGLTAERARTLGVRDAFNPAENLDGGVRLVKKLDEVFQGDLSLMLAGYKAGEARVKEFNGIPPSVETIAYVSNVGKIYDCLRRDSNRLSADASLLPEPMGGGKEADSLSRQALNERFAEAIRATLDVKVVYEDVLGEGTNGWDSNPRYPHKIVNCLVWLQLVISEIYGKGLSDRTVVMDRLRYYGGHVGFSSRKHYLDQWLAFDPKPLVRIDPKSCGVSTARKLIRLNPQVLLADRNFPCMLYKMEDVDFYLDYLNKEALLQCTKTLPSGYYIMFAVASDLYLELYPASGPMGLVHAIVLQLDPLSKGAVERSPEDARIYHASTKAGGVRSVGLRNYLEGNQPIHLGYVIYELDPTWNFRAPTPMTDEIRQLLECEAQIVGKRQNWTFKTRG
jgi:hypothetical protein